MEAPTINEMQDWSQKILEGIRATEENIEKTRDQVKKLKLNLKKFQVTSGIWGAVAALVIVAIIMTGSMFSSTKNESEEKQVYSQINKVFDSRFPE